MEKLRFYFALICAKLARRVLQLLGRRGTLMPGEIAIKICKDFLGYITPPKTVICVTGTNGKTTVSNLLRNVLISAGYTVTGNQFGSNVQSGITTALLADCDFFGRAKSEIAVLEVDERSSLLVYPYITPDYLICNNIMRDSLKRNAHTEFISFILNKAIPETTKIILNADDIICAYLAPQCKNRTYFGLDAEKPETSAVQLVSDIYYCPVCGEPLCSEYIRYNHIGRVYCPVCGHRTPERDYVVSEIDRAAETFTVMHRGVSNTYRLINDNIVNVYNFCGTVALFSEFGLSAEQITEGFKSSGIVKTRFDTVTNDRLKITMLLAKGQNPIACSRCYSYVSKAEGEKKCMLILVDDKGDNINNSESTCWLYDCDYTFLADESIAKIVFAGKRCRDQLLRALLAGVQPEKTVITDDASDGARLINTEEYNNIYVLYDPYLLKEADEAKKILSQAGGKNS